jgi:hypothetical protein
MATLRVRNRCPPSLEGNSGPSVVLGRSTGPPKLHPPNHTPPTHETLPVKHFVANSRILTDYYHLPAVLRSAHRRRNSASRSVPGRRAAHASIPRPVQKWAENECKTTTIQPLQPHCFTVHAAGDLTRNLLRDWSQITGHRPVSAPVCAGTQGFRADPLRPGYAQEFGGRADPAPAAPNAWRTPRQVPDAAPRGGASDAP